MIVAGDFRKGVTFEMDGGVWTVTDFMHVKPGKGSPFVRSTLKNVITGKVLENTFNPTDKFEEATIERKNMQYSYSDGDLYFFMDTATFDLIPLDKAQVESALGYIKDETVCQVQFFKGKAFSVVPPMFVELLITECEPGLQGDTSKAGNKPAKLETGVTIQVPLFVNEGEIIRVDTRDGTYMERVKK